MKPTAKFSKALCFVKNFDWADHLSSLQQAYELITRIPKTTGIYQERKLQYQIKVQIIKGYFGVLCVLFAAQPLCFRLFGFSFFISQTGENSLRRDALSNSSCGKIENSPNSLCSSPKFTIFFPRKNHLTLRLDNHFLPCLCDLKIESFWQ